MPHDVVARERERDGWGLTRLVSSAGGSAGESSTFCWRRIDTLTKGSLNMDTLTKCSLNMGALTEGSLKMGALTIMQSSVNPKSSSNLAATSPAST